MKKTFTRLCAAMLASTMLTVPAFAELKDDADEIEEVAIVIDANGNEVAVRAISDGLLLRYEIEKTEEGSFPITVDPRVSYSDTVNTMESAYIVSGNPNHVYNSNYLFAGVLGSSSQTEYVSLIRAGVLVPQKASDTILSAQLYMWNTAYGDSDRYIGAYSILSQWDESTATWNSQTARPPSHSRVARRRRPPACRRELTTP